MGGLDGSPIEVVGGLLGLALVFALREFLSGALRQAGEDLWEQGRRRGKARRPDE